MTNARPVIVRINERGPYTRGRVIDLSYAAAAAPDLPRAGTLLVRIERVGKQDAGTESRCILRGQVTRAA